jgi:hypothetical protein
MTREQFNEALLRGFYTTIPSAAPLNVKNFLAATISSTWTNHPPPEKMRSYWYDRVALAIQNELLKQQEYLPGLDGTWLAANKHKKWGEVSTWVFGTGEQESKLAPYNVYNAP